MPPLLILAAIGAGAYLGIKWANGQKLSRRSRQTGKAKAQQGTGQTKPDAATLKKDPVTGVYRVDE